MTVKVTYLGGTDQALEIIETFSGVERTRLRIHNGEDAQLQFDGSTTHILRELPVTAPPESRPGEQRHGDLGPATDQQLRARIAQLETQLTDSQAYIENLEAHVDELGATVIELRTAAGV